MSMAALKKSSEKELSMAGEDTLREIKVQPVVWAEVIGLVSRQTKDLEAMLHSTGGIILTGCGSALNIAFAAAPILQRFAGVVARAIPAADLVQFPEACLPADGKSLVIGISRSGETTETVYAVRMAKERGCPTLALTCFPSTMSREAQAAIILTCCQEKSICTTNSVTGMVLALQLALGGRQTGFRAQLERLPEIGEHLIGKAMELGEGFGKESAIAKYAFLGSGPLYGIARECQLKLKEMTLLPSDSYPLMDYRHGPKSNIDQGMLMTMLCSTVGGDWERECADELMQYGGRLLAIGDGSFSGGHTHRLDLASGLDDYARPILYLPLVQTMAVYKAISLGMDPDRPQNLSYWVKTEAPANHRPQPNA